MKFAIVGCGAIARAHAEALERAEGARLVAVVDPLEPARTAFEHRWGCRSFIDVAAMLGETEIEAACLCTPPATHLDLAMMLLDGGAHLLCEKPMAVSSPDAADMVAHAERLNLALCVSAKFRFIGDLDRARVLLDEGAIGKPLSVKITFCAPLPTAEGWHRQIELSGGGVVMDNAPHAFDVLSVLFDGAPVVAAAMLGPSARNGDVEETAEILFRIPDGPHGRIELSWAYGHETLDYVVVHGERGTIRVGWTGGAIRRRHDGPWEPFGSGYDKASAFDGVLADFISGIESRTGASARPQRAIAFIEAIYSVERSA